MSTNLRPTLVDWASRRDPDGKTAIIAEMLSQANAVLNDMVWVEANQATSHRYTVRTTLPQGTWRNMNQGVASGKSQTQPLAASIGELVAYSVVDKSIADLEGDAAAYRESEDRAYIQGMSQQVASALFYANEAITANTFTGFAPMYATTNTAIVQSARNTLSAGGTGSANASIWLVGWGINETFGIFPKGSVAGLHFENKGDTVPDYDSNGNRFEAYTSHFSFKLGLCVKDWRWNVRIANIDTTTAGIYGSSYPDLFSLMARAALQAPHGSLQFSGVTQTDDPRDPSGMKNHAFYVNRTVRWALDYQAMRNKNVLISIREHAGKVVEDFRGVPIKVVDALTNSEATVS